MFEVLEMIAEFGVLEEKDEKDVEVEDEANGETR